MSAPVLVLNAGSSSLKYQVIKPDSGESLSDGIVEQIGEPSSPAADHRAALQVTFATLAKQGIDVTTCGLAAVGHRVVHGGAAFYRPTIIDDAVVVELEILSTLAPLHNPPAVEGIKVARTMLPTVPHVAVFDTAFFHDLPAAAATYAIDRTLSQKWQIRRYGFHGTSHRYVSEQAAAFLNRPSAELNQIVLHLGNGASVSAIAGGRPAETSMGLTPLEGLVMGTRSGDVDAGIVSYLNRTAGMSVEDIDSMLNHRSGLFGLSGERDFRRLRELIESGDSAARLAYDVFIHRLRKYIGGYLAVLGRVDAISFTAGVGENVAAVRMDTLRGLTGLGIEVDAQRNSLPDNGPRRISTDSSPIDVLVVPTDEELAIARDCLQVI